MVFNMHVIYMYICNEITKKICLNFYGVNILVNILTWGIIYVFENGNSSLKNWIIYLVLQNVMAVRRSCANEFVCLA